MKQKQYLAAACAVVLTFAGGLMIAPARAQQDAPPAPTPSGTKAGMRPVADLVARLSQGAGVAIVADSTVREVRAPLPAEPTTAANFEQQIADIVAALPEGATWAKLFLPAPASGRNYNGDDVAAYALAQVKLFGPVGASTPGTVEVMGRKVPEGKAAAYVADLNLKPVYLITNPRTTRATTADGRPTADQWAAMTPDQRQAYAQREAQNMLRMSPVQRQQMMEQQRAVFGAMMSQMTPEQRAQMFGGRGDRGDRGGPGRGDRGPRNQ